MDNYIPFFAPASSSTVVVDESSRNLYEGKISQKTQQSSSQAFKTISILFGSSVIASKSPNLRNFYSALAIIESAKTLINSIFSEKLKA